LSKDGDLQHLVEPPADLTQSRTRDQLREWTMLGWWAASDIAKYLQRGSLFEAAARVECVREQALRLHAFAIGVPDPTYGLTSLLDYPPFELPAGLADTYCRPDDRASVVAAAHAAEALLTSAAEHAARRGSTDLTTPWAITAQRRLRDATTERHD
jgi:hypothetical protein